MFNKAEFSIFNNAGLIYSTTQNHSHYECTDIATGDLDLERLINEDVKCWRLPVTTQDYKRKKIIITDLKTRFKIYTCNDSDTKDAYLEEFELWNALLSYGFEIYAWTGTLVPIKNVDDLMTNLFLIEPIKTSHLIEKLKVSGFNKDECFFATTENSGKLFTDVFINNTRIKLDSIGLQHSYKIVANSLLVLMSLPYRLLQDYLDTLDLDPDKPFTIESNLSTVLIYDCSNFLKKIAYLNPEINLQRLRVGADGYYEDSLPEMPDIPKALVPYIKGIRIELKESFLKFNEQKLLDFFADFKHIERFELCEATILKSKPKVNYDDYTTIFNSLKNLKLESVTLSNSKFYFFMLNNSPNLKELTLKSCLIDMGDFHLNENALKSVRKLVCKEIEYISHWDPLIPGTDLLINIIMATECLEQLQVEAICIPDKMLIALDPSRLKNIHELEITRSLSIDDVNFINLCSNLESLIVNITLEHFDNQTFFDILNQLNLPRLHSVSFTNKGKNIPVERFPSQRNTPDEAIDYPFEIIELAQFDDKIREFSMQSKAANKTNFLTLLREKNGVNNNALIAHNADFDKDEEEYFDGETGPDDEELTAVEYFCPKKGKDDTGRYRLDTFKFSGPGEQLSFVRVPSNKPIMLDVPQEEEVSTIYDDKYQQTTDVFLGKLELFPKEQGKWIKLPSFTPDDTILMVSTIPNNVVTIKKSVNNFHYIHINATCTEPVVFQFLLKTPEWAFKRYEALPINVEPVFNVLRQGYFDNSGCYTLPDYLHPAFHLIQQLHVEQKIYLISSFCQGFTVEELLHIKITEQANHWELLNQVIREQKGSCRHRAKVFVVLASIFGIEAELVRNDCHEFVQVRHPDKGWRIHDLGGAEAQLNLIKFNENTAKQPKQITRNNQNIEAENPYICWQWQKSSAKTFGAYCTELFTSIQRFEAGKKNILVSLKHEQIEGFLANLQVVQQNEGRRYIYIENLDNIRTSEVVLGANGEKHKQDSGLITGIKHAQAGDVLIVNQFEMKAEHIVYNTMMDTQQRTLKGTALPEGLILISLQPNNRSASEDVHSRFQLRSKCPMDLRSTLSYPSVVKTLNDDQQKLLCINMYFPDEYKQLMTVRLTCNGSIISVIESQLIAALKKGDSGVVIRNAPWNDQGFRTFLGEMLYSRRFEANGQSIKIPADFSFVLWDKPYELCMDNLSENTYSSSTAPSGIKILNNLTFKSFFTLFSCIKGDFHTMPGWIEQYKGQTLPVVVSHELSETHSALLLEEARRFATKFEYIKITQSPQDKPDIINPIMVASDLDLAEALHFSDSSEFRIIPVSEMTNYNDLIERYERTDSGTYQHSMSCVAQLLLEGMRIVLKGELSPLLQKQLSSLLLPVPYLLINGQYHEVKAGQFKLLTTQAIQGNFFKCHKMSLPTPWEPLEKQFPQALVMQAKKLCDAYTARLPKEPSFSYIQLQVILTRLVKKPYSNPFKPILRLKSNYQELKFIIEQLWDINDPAKDYLSFDLHDTTKLRIEKVFAELQHSPYVFVAGSSGSGKSTLFLHQLERLVPGTQVFGGLDKINEWLQSTSSRPFLVIDEANLLNKDAFGFLEPLFQNQPSVLMDGKLKPISQRHKIIFVGNFGYFKDRSQQEFFNRHGHIITFKELPDSILKHHVLLPILSTQPMCTERLDELAASLLRAYKEMRVSLQDTITTRNLEMLAWRLLDNLRYAKDNNALCLAVYDEFQIFFTQKERLTFLGSLDDYKVMKAERNNVLVLSESDFIITPTRRNPLRLINQFLQIREQKLTSTRYFTGVQGIILEGDSAEGKSSLLKHYLDSNKFVLAAEGNITSLKRYYMIDDLGSLEPVLYQAFHEGALVIINEMNTMPVELLLNQYMSGVDKEGLCAKKMGFTVLATQNPISFDFRKPLSAALLNRFQMIVLKEYKQEEIKMIAHSFCKKEDEAQKEAEQYINARNHAKDNGFLRPNLRRLINVCGEKRKAEEDDTESHKRSRL